MAPPRLQMVLSVKKKIDYVTTFKKILNPEGHSNCITGSKVTAILLNGWILYICGASSGKGLHLQPAQQACFNISQVILINSVTEQKQSKLNIKAYFE